MELQNYEEKDYHPYLEGIIGLCYETSVERHRKPLLTCIAEEAWEMASNQETEDNIYMFLADKDYKDFGYKTAVEARNALSEDDKVWQHVLSPLTLEDTVTQVREILTEHQVFFIDESEEPINCPVIEVW